MCICSPFHPESRLNATVEECQKINSWLQEKLNYKLNCVQCHAESDIISDVVQIAWYCLECNNCSGKITYVCEKCAFENTFNARYILYKFIRPTPLAAVVFSE